MDLLDVAFKHLTEEHFPDPVQQNIFRLLHRYAGATNAVLPMKHLDDLISRKKDNSSFVILRESYQALTEQKTSDSDFNWSITQLREHYAETKTEEALVEARELLKSSDPDESGMTRHEAARQHLQEAMVAIERGMQMAASPEGMLNEEQDELIDDYAERKKARESGTTSAIRFGIEELDRKTGGMQPGELVMSAAYSGEGKTTLTIQASWSAAVEQGKNVVFFSTETVREQIRRKIIARHSRLEKFGLPQGLNTRDLKNGTLSPEEEEIYQKVVEDFTTNPAYGRIYIVQVPRSASITSLDHQLRRLQNIFHIDFVVMDYLALLTPERSRTSTREELANILKEAKKVATSFDNGRGVPFLSPWQVSRAARDDAERIGSYTSRALSETAEATNSADMIVSLLAPLDNSDRIAMLTMQVLKNRDGETAQSIMVEVDYANAYFRSRTGVSLGDSATSVLSL